MKNYDQNREVNTAQMTTDTKHEAIYNSYASHLKGQLGKFGSSLLKNKVFSLPRYL